MRLVVVVFIFIATIGIDSIAIEPGFLGREGLTLEHRRDP
jgi:hypothetical protein